MVGGSGRSGHGVKASSRSRGWRSGGSREVIGIHFRARAPVTLGRTNYGVVFAGTFGGRGGGRRRKTRPHRGFVAQVRRVQPDFLEKGPGRGRAGVPEILFPFSGGRAHPASPAVWPRGL